MRLSVVLWDGNVGGAEKVTAELAAALRAVGVDATVVFVRDPAILANDLERLDVPYVSLNASRVEEVLWKAHSFARIVGEYGPDGALLPAVGHQAPALRAGGYRGPIVAIEHGFLLLMETMKPGWRIARRGERRIAARFVDAEVAVSDYMRAEILKAPHAPRVERIYNGTDLARYGAGSSSASSCVFGCASRFVDGKGVDPLMRAFGRVPGARLRIAGAGPDPERLMALAPASVEFLGVV